MLTERQRNSQSRWRSSISVAGVSPIRPFIRLYTEPHLVALTQGIDRIEYYGKCITVQAYVDDLVVFESLQKRCLVMPENSVV